MRRSYVPFALAVPAFAAGLLAASALPASAKFSVCNTTAQPATVALGFYNGKEWGSAGWWTIAPGGCTMLINEPLISRYYYLYAEHQNVGGAWDGDRSFCVKSGHFSIQGRTNCLSHGYEVRRFFQVDTGTSPDWTENLAD